MEIINRFERIHKDNSEALQPEGSVRNLENFCIYAADGKNYSIQSVKGTLDKITFPDKFNVICLIVGLDRKYYIGYYDNDKKPGEIGEITKDPNTGIETLTPIYIDDDFGLSNDFPGEAFSVIENEKRHWLYWIDGKSKFRSFNTLEPRATRNWTAADVPANSGKSFRVLRGRIQLDNNDILGPSVGRVNFISTGAAIIDLDGGLILKEATDVDSVIDTPGKALAGEITFSDYISGNAFSGSYTFLYRLYSYFGYYTPWSQASRPMFLTPDFSPDQDEKFYGKLGGRDDDFSTTRGIQVKLSNVDVSYSNVQVAVIKSNGVSGALTPQIFHDGPVLSSSFTVDYTGGGIENTTIDLLKQVVINILAPKAFAIAKNKLILANFREAAQNKFDFNSYVNIFIDRYQLPTDGVGENRPAVDGFIYGHTPYPVNGKVIPGGKYMVTAGSVQYPAITGTTYTVGQVFTGQSGKLSWIDLQIGTTIVKYAIELKKYTGSGGTEWHREALNTFLADYKNPRIAEKLSTFRRDEIERIGIMFYDTVRNPLFVIWLRDIKFPAIYSTKDPNRAATDPNYFLPWGQNSLVERFPNGEAVLNLNGIKININFLPIFQQVLGISNASEIKNYFSGFSIVKAPIQGQIKHQGVIKHVLKDSNVSTYPTGNVAPLDPDNIYASRLLFQYLYYSPETMFNFDGKGNQYEVSDFIEVAAYVEDNLAETAYKGHGQTNVSSANRYHKCYDTDIPFSTGSFFEGDTNEILNAVNIEAGEGPKTLVTGQDFSNIANTFSFGSVVAAKCVWISTATGKEYRAGSTNGIAVVNWKRAAPGGFANSKSSTTYVTLGHFQAFDDVLLTKAPDLNLSGIQVYGGGYFLNIFAFEAVIGRRKLLVPLESKINTGLREGPNAGNNMGLGFPNNPEIFKYNESYSNDSSFLQYPAFPENFDPSEDFSYRVRNSEDKIIAHREDGYKKFLPNNYKDINGSYGPVIGLKYKDNYLFYWQPLSIGYLPIGERQLLTGSIGGSLTVGEGGALKRFDDIATFYGCDNKFSILEIPDGFLWFDNRKKTLAFLRGQSVMEIDTIKGMNSYFTNLIGDFRTVKNHLLQKGIVTVYNQRKREALFAFHISDTEGVVVGVNALKMDFMSQYAFQPRLMLAYEEGFYSIYKSGTFQKMALHDAIPDYGKFYGTVLPSKVEIIVNPLIDLEKVWENFIFFGNDKFIDDIQIFTPEQSGSDLDVIRTANSEYYYYNGKWHSTIPFDVDGRRFEYPYLRIVLTKDNRLFKNDATQASGEQLMLTYLKSIYRKAF